MGKAEAGTPKYLDNKSKQRGLTKLNFYCQVCEKANRDEHGFRMHTQSESHVRRVQLLGSDAKKYIEDFSKQFLNDFMRLLRTAHGEKSVVLNHFYQEYIADRHHIHMNATKWHSLTEFGAWLGKEGLCRVEDVEGKGLHVAYVDNSPEALMRRDDLKRREALQQGDEELEQRIIREQIKRAKAQAEARGSKRKADDLEDDDENEENRELKRTEGEKITLSFGTKKTTSKDATEKDDKAESTTPSDPANDSAAPPPQAPAKPSGFGGISLKKSGKPQARNIFAEAEEEEEAAGGPKLIKQEKKMSVVERIMKEEQEKKQRRPGGSHGGGGTGGGFSFGMPAAKKQRQ